MSQLDLITKALRIGAFSGLAITIFALATDSNWLLENKYLIKPKDKGKDWSINGLLYHYN